VDEVYFNPLILKLIASNVDFSLYYLGLFGLEIDRTGLLVF
jgi:hypothetical protein